MRRTASNAHAAFVACAVLAAIASGGCASRVFDRTPVNLAARQSPNLIGTLRSHVVGGDETLIDLARRYELGYVELLAANPGVDPWLPGDGRRVVIPGVHLLPDAPREGIVINLAEQRLYDFTPAAGTESYPIGVSREGWTTPLGTTEVVRKREAPIWYPTHSALREDPELPRAVPPGPDNPLGTHALYLAWPKYLIHGTNEPDGVGRRVSRGCIRLYPEHITRLFAQIPVGTPVRVIDDPVKLARTDYGLFLEVHPTLHQAGEIGAGEAATPTPVRDLEARVRRAAGRRVDEVDWELVAEVGRERRGVPIQIIR